MMKTNKLYWNWQTLFNIPYLHQQSCFAPSSSEFTTILKKKLNFNLNIFQSELICDCKNFTVALSSAAVLFSVIKDPKYFPLSKTAPYNNPITNYPNTNQPRHLANKKNNNKKFNKNEGFFKNQPVVNNLDQSLPLVSTVLLGPSDIEEESYMKEVISRAFPTNFIIRAIVKLKFNDLILEIFKQNNKENFKQDNKICDLKILVGTLGFKSLESLVDKIDEVGLFSIYKNRSHLYEKFSREYSRDILSETSDGLFTIIHIVSLAQNFWNEERKSADLSKITETKAYPAYIVYFVQ
jgi:hypothetical protein